MGFHELKYMKGLGNLKFRSVKVPKKANRRILWRWAKMGKLADFTRHIKVYEVYERVGKSVASVCKRTYRHILQR